MPFKTGSERYRKWFDKYDPDTVKARFTQVATIAAEKAQTQLNIFYAAEDRARKRLFELGLSTIVIPFYLDVVRECTKKVQQHSGETLDIEMAAIKAKWVARGLNPGIVDEMLYVCSGLMPLY